MTDHLRIGIVLLAVSLAAWRDARTGRIPDSITLAFTGILLAVAVFENALYSALTGAVVAFALMLVIYLLSARRGIGLGDVKLAAVIGAGLGAKWGTVALGIAFIAGAIYGVTLLGLGRATRKSAIRFGPFLAAGTFFSCLCSTVVTL